MSERKPGWYWAVLDGEWAPLYWDGVAWKYIGTRQSAVAGVASRIPTPDEPWQCVPIESTWQMEGVADIDPYDYQQILSVAPKP